MKIAEVKKMPPIERFLYWIRERDQILKKRRAGFPKPWTDDEILQTQYFTNVRREDDRVTIWFRENVRDRLKDDPIVVFATIAFRWFNLPAPTGEYLNSHGYLENWNMEKAIGGLLRFQNSGLKVFTGAFNISNSGSTKPKVNRVCEDYIQPVWKDLGVILAKFRLGTTACTLANAFKVLKGYPGLGGSGFMAGQVVCDLAYTDFFQHASDWHTFCTWGPGSKRGMNRVFGEHEDYAMPRAIWDRNLFYLMEVVEKRLNIKLHARDLQNCLCEMGKYERGLEGTRLKRRYPGK